MKILMVQPNYHSGGAEIAGNWTPSWVAYIGGALKQAGFDQIRFVDAMADDLPDDQIEEIIRTNKPDVVMTTNITPSIFKAQDIMKIAKKVNPKIRTLMGGIHSTFMYPQVLSEAPETDYVIRGEGEEVAVNLIRSIANGTDKQDRAEITGIAYVDDEGKVFATPAHPVIEDLDTLSPDWSLYDWDKYIYTPLNCRLAVPNFAR
ncbi:MAG: magnesium-protoporphyrin IX monomethyl ester cyclase, partial [Chlorobiaceae bacterium]|nr:magnesium-protoporphyrin IX monomethyl ester cyclase [Chlorobiaceae bacterium]